MKAKTLMIVLRSMACHILRQGLRAGWQTCSGQSQAVCNRAIRLPLSSARANMLHGTRANPPPLPVWARQGDTDTDGAEANQYGTCPVQEVAQLVRKLLRDFPSDPKPSIFHEADPTRAQSVLLLLKCHWSCFRQQHYEDKRCDFRLLLFRQNPLLIA